MTRSLLGYGVLADVFYLGVGIVQGLFRDGYEHTRHDLSLNASATKDAGTASTILNWSP